MPPSGEDRRIERGATLLKEQSELGKLESSHGVAESTEEEGIFRHGIQFRHEHPRQETLPDLRQDLRVRLGGHKAGNQLAVCFDLAFPGAKRIDHDEPDTMPGEEACD